MDDPAHRVGPDAAEPSVPARGPSLASVLVCVLVGAILAVVLRGHGTDALDDDGPGLAWMFALAGDSHPGWHHAAYAYVVLALDALLGDSMNGTLLWVSASGAALGAALFAIALLRLGAGPLATSIVSLGLVASPAFVSNATRIEVHGTQVLGCAVLLWAVASRARSTARAGIGDGACLALGAFVAATLHSSSLLLVPGCALLLVARADASARLRSWGAALLGLVVGSSAALVANALEAGRGIARTHANPVELFGVFAGDDTLGEQLRSLSVEVLEPWSAAWVSLLALTILRPPRLRPLLPWLVAAAPAIVLLGPTGIDSDGGYYVGSFMFLAGGVVAAFAPGSTASRPVPAPRLAAVVGIAASGVWFGGAESLAILEGDSRTELAAYRGQRLATARAALPDGGVYVQVDWLFQPICALERDLFEIPVYVDVEEGARQGLDPDVVFARAMDELAIHTAAGRPLAWWTGWRALAPADQGPGALLDEFERRLHERYALEEVDVFGQPYLRGPVRP